MTSIPKLDIEAPFSKPKWTRDVARVKGYAAALFDGTLDIIKQKLRRGCRGREAYKVAVSLKYSFVSAR